MIVCASTAQRQKSGENGIKPERQAMPRPQKYLRILYKAPLAQIEPSTHIP